MAGLATVTFALFATALSAQDLSAPPWVRQGGVVNAASQLPLNVPGGALASGALVEIEGLRFDPPSLNVEIESGGAILTAAVIGATSERILVRLPRVKSTGPARLYVRSRSKRSAGSDISLSASAFGIFTTNGKGWGPAASLDKPEGTPAELPQLRRGAMATLSGTGLGNAAADAIEVFVGDRRASRISRSESNTIERLSFAVPMEAPLGCAVPVTVRTGTAVSNTAIVSIGGNAGCGAQRAWYEGTPPAGEKSANAILLRSDVILELARGKPRPFVLDSFSAGFVRHAGEQQQSPLDLVPASGACLSWAGSVDSNQLMLPSLVGPTPDKPETLDLGPDVARQTAALEDLDAGADLTITGPAGIRPAPRSIHKPRVYSAILGGNPPLTRIPSTPLFLAPGDYNIATSGGTDVGPVTATLKVPDSIVWRNRESIAALDRRLGAQLDWNLPEGYTAVVVAWNIDRRNGLAGIAVCMPPAKARQFRIPPIAVANLPATLLTGSDLSLGFLGVAALPLDPPSFTAKGLDRGRLISASLSGRSVVIK